MTTEEIVRKIDRLDERLDSIDKHLAVYNQQLAEHMRRTELLENEVHPIREHVVKMQGAGKLVSYISLSVGAILGILKLFGKI